MRLEAAIVHLCVHSSCKLVDPERIRSSFSKMRFFKELSITGKILFIHYLSRELHFKRSKVFFKVVVVTFLSLTDAGWRLWKQFLGLLQFVVFSLKNFFKN